MGIPIRSTFRPNAQDQLFVKVDYSQLEDRVGKMYCQTPKLVELANTKPWEYDAHTDNAKLIFGKPDGVTPEERQLGKFTVHGYWRGIGPNKLAETVLKRTQGKVVKSPQECRWLLEKFEAAMPQIKGIYMPWAEEQARSGVCINSFGRQFETRHFRLDETFLRKVYSFYPQADGADMMMQLGVKPGDRWLKARYGYGLSMQVHDEIIASVPYKDVWEFFTFIKKEMERPVKILGNTLSCTATAKISTTLYKGIEFEKFVPKEEFYEKLNGYLDTQKW